MHQQLQQVREEEEEEEDIPHIRGCHMVFFPFSDLTEWWRGTLSLNGGGPIVGEAKP